MEVVCVVFEARPGPGWWLVCVALGPSLPQRAMPGGPHAQRVEKNEAGDNWPSPGSPVQDIDFIDRFDPRYRGLDLRSVWVPPRQA
jgi:hypothetical protein